MTPPYRLFIAGTGTNVGKTTVATALALGLRQRGLDIAYWKPVQTGTSEGCDSQTLSHALAGKLPIIPELCQLPLPASPDQAAQAAQVESPKLSNIIEVWRQLQHRYTLIEGAGGLFVPLNERNETWIDLLTQTNMPTLLVASSSLGTINHTLLSVEALTHRAIPLLGIVLSGPRHLANEQTLKRMLPHIPLCHLPEYTPSITPVDELSEFVWQQIHAHAQANASTWLEADRQHVWHPYTQHKTAPAPTPIQRAQGIWLETSEGTRLVDGTSSWWVNTIGHGRPEIAAAIAQQQQTLDHVLFAGAAHAPAAKLAACLADLTRPTSTASTHLSRTFYSDNGSTAVEVALKMAYQAWVNRGETNRRLFVSFTGSYHGDTFGAMSVATADGFHGVFKPLLFETLRAPVVTRHASALCPEGRSALAERLTLFKQIILQNQQKIAGVILEPLVQGSAGMLMQPPEFAQEVAQICAQHSIPLIFDEVFTGLGRCGASFAFQRLGVAPDIICAAKGLTGGNLPLAVTLSREEFFQSFLRDDKAQALLHGHSFTANPIACSAALASMRILQEENLAQRAQALEQRFAAWIEQQEQHLPIENARTTGGILAFELGGTGLGDYFHPRAAAVPGIAQKHGLFLRPLGNTLYFVPPLVIGDDELSWCLERLERVVSELLT